MPGFDYTVRYSATLKVDVRCEDCGTHYSYNRQVEVSAQTKRPSSVTEDLKQEFESKVRSVKRHRKVGHKACPKCKYVQSWMQEHWRRWKALKWALLVFGIPSGIFLLIVGIVFVDFFDYDFNVRILPGAYINVLFAIWLMMLVLGAICGLYQCKRTLNARRVHGVLPPAADPAITIIPQ